MSDDPRNSASVDETATPGLGLIDPAWLVQGDPEEVLAALEQAAGPDAAAAVAVYRVSGHVHRDADAHVRGQALALDAARYGDRTLARAFAGLTDGGWVVRWATGNGLDSRLRYALPAPAEVGVVATVVAEDSGIAVGGCKDGTLHWWDLAGGRKLGALATDHDGAVEGLVTAVVNGRPVAVTCGPDGAARVWDLAAGDLVRLYRADDGSRVTELAIGVVEGRPVVVGGCTGGVIRVWGLADRSGSGELLTVRTGAFGALATAVVDGRSVAVTGHAEGTVRVWDLVTGREFGAPRDRAEAGEDSGPGCTTLYLDARTNLLATDPTFAHPMALGASTYAVSRWNLATGRQLGDPGGAGLVQSAALTVLDGRPVALVSIHRHGAVAVAELSTLQPLQPPLTGHAGSVRGTATAVLSGRHLAVTGGEDRSVRIWDLDTPPDAGRPPADSSGVVRAVATAVVDGRSVVVTAGADTRVRIMDLDDGAQLGEPLIGYSGAPGRLTVGTVAGRPTLLTRDVGRKVRLWDLTTREELPSPTSTEYAGSYVEFFAALEDRFVAVTTEGRVWDLTTSRWIGVKPRQAGALALETVGDRAVVLTGRWTDAAHAWDLATGEPIGPPMTGHSGHARAGAAGLLNDRLVVATGDAHGTVRVWDAATGRRTGEYVFPADITALALAPDGRLVVGFGPDIAVLRHGGSP